MWVGRNRGTDITWWVQDPSTPYSVRDPRDRSKEKDAACIWTLGCSACRKSGYSCKGGLSCYQQHSALGSNPRQAIILEANTFFVSYSFGKALSITRKIKISSEINKVAEGFGFVDAILFTALGFKILPAHIMPWIQPIHVLGEPRRYFGVSYSLWLNIDDKGLTNGNTNKLDLLACIMFACKQTCMFQIKGLFQAFEKQAFVNLNWA